MDQDEWLDAEDNCPETFNPEQRDRDHDGIGDTCDSCPATPNNGQDGQVAQTACDVVEEVEPNDSNAAAMSISLVPADRILEVRGAIERPGTNGQAWDRYQVMVPARTMIHVRVARTRPESLLEPIVEVTGGSFESPRTADDLFVAERDVYCSAAGTYVISVADRRGAFDDAPEGDMLYEYALSIRAISYGVESVTAPFQDRLFNLLPAGTVKILEADLEPSMRLRVATKTPFGSGAMEGFDPILVLETDDGATVQENNDVAAGYLDARILTSIATAQRVRVVIDFARLYGMTSNSVQLSLDQPEDGFELEPDDIPELASPLVWPNGETTAEIDHPRGNIPDIDVFALDGVAGQIVNINVLISTNSLVNPYLIFGRLDAAGEFEVLQANDDSSGIASRVDTLIGEDGTYYVVVGDEMNRDDPPYRGGDLFKYSVFCEQGGLQLASTVTTTIGGTIQGTINPTGRIIRHAVMTTGPGLLELETTMTGSPDFHPYYRVFGPSVIGELGGGEEQVFAYLPSAASYIVGVQSADASGTAASLQSYTANVTVHPITSTMEVEPNDTEAQAQMIEDAISVVEGTLANANDKDRTRLFIPAGGAIDAILMKGARTRTVSIYRFGNNTALISGAGGLQAFNVPGAGQYIIEVSGPGAGPYALLLRVR